VDVPAREIDIGQLQDRLAPAGIAGLQVLSGGASSLTYTGRMPAAADRRVVVKVAPPGVPPVLNRDVLRQSRLLRSLRPAGIPVPEIISEDGGDPPAVPPLFVMSFVEGSALEPLFDRDGDQDEAEVAEAMGNAVRTLGSVHLLQPDQLGLQHEPRQGPAEEIERWHRLLETVDAALVPGWREISRRLHAALPPARPPAIVHGDFRLGNLLTVRGRIMAVVDWEIWSVGDPRVDLGWFLLNADPATYRRRTRYTSSLPRPEELIGIYAERTGERPSDLHWFQALAGFKSAATWALIVKHNRRRPSPDPELEEMALALPGLLERAGQLLA
jgi:aminoglycoside phosphotransferase (APT) family kinase protein